MNDSSDEQRSLCDFFAQNKHFCFEKTGSDDLKSFWSYAFNEVARANEITVKDIQPNWSQAKSQYIKFLREIMAAAAKSPSCSNPLVTFTSSTSSTTASCFLPLTPSCRQDIMDKFSAMNQEKKWCIAEDVYLEDIVFKIGQAKQREDICHSFIVDMNDLCYKTHLSISQIKSVAAHGLSPLPSVSDALKKAMDDLKNQPTEDVLGFALDQLKVNKNNEEVYTFFLSFINMYQVKQSGFFSRSDLSETDIMVNVWKNVVDIQFMKSSKFTCYRGENTSLNSATRKQTEQRKKMGRRSDLLVRKGDAEFLYGEASLNSSDMDKKNLYDSNIKTKKALKDMLHCLCQKVEPDTIPRLRTVGLQFSSKFHLLLLLLLLKYYVNLFFSPGFNLEAYYMDMPKGYCARVTKTPTICFDEDEFVDTFVKWFLLVKKALLVCEETATLIAENKKRNDDNDFVIPFENDEMEYPLCLPSPPHPSSDQSKKRRLS
ncbi:hypothetical protein EDC96DRAFT_340475 [Choanephora cucurbitarum]|nr:hypothetical protein EDC96DRAFT_340475 [Choanephora cucurbitarum]